VANTSQHLQVLRAARLLVAERSGLHVTYQLADAEVGRFYRALQLLAESRLSELDRIAGDFLESRGLAEAVDRDALVERVRRGTVTVLDVRPREEYAAGHIAGAVSVPLPELERRLSELPKDREIVAYCRGRFCVLAVEAVVRLRARGYRAVRLEDGVPDWRARGFRITVGT
jgi:rhodanese-related sulfurtransferase